MIALLYNVFFAKLNGYPTPSGMPWGVRSRQNITSWRDENVNYICKCTPIGALVQMPPVAKSGNGKIPTTEEII